VRLVSGEELLAPRVVGAIDPKTLVGELVEPELVPDQTRRELRAMNVLKWNISHFKADAVLSARPKLACGRDELLQGYLLLAETFDHIRRAQAAAIAGRFAPQPPQWVALPSIPDRTQIPPGATGETFFAYAPIAPLTLRDGRSWDQVQDAYADALIDDLDPYLPGVGELIVGRSIQNPDSFRDRAVGGHVMHADVSISQMGPSRPTPSLSGYRTPVSGLWHSASGAHPIGLLSGWSGRTTARLVTRDLLRAGRRRNARPLKLTHLYDSLTELSREDPAGGHVAPTLSSRR
jgi:beta-carotene ketolase (CrtO type)